MLLPAARRGRHNCRSDSVTEVRRRSSYVGVSLSTSIGAGRIRNRQIRVAELDSLVAAGFRVVRTPPSGQHFDIDLGRSIQVGALEPSPLFSLNRR